MNIPTLPILSAGALTHAADLNNIASACTFLLTKPMSRIHDTVGGAVIGTTFGAATFNTLDFDTDSTWSNTHASRLTVQTPGWYKARYSIQIASASTPAQTYNTCVRGTTGPNNPLGSNVSLARVLAGYAFQNTGTGTPFAGASGEIPYYLYAGDYLQVLIQANNTGGTTGIDAGMPNSFFSIEFVSI